MTSLNYNCNVMMGRLTKLDRYTGLCRIQSGFKEKYFKDGGKKKILQKKIFNMDLLAYDIKRASLSISYFSHPFRNS